MTAAKTSLSIDWIVNGVSGNDSSTWDSPLASNRYRAILPARSLVESGHRVRFVEASTWNSAPPDHADVVIVGKLLPGSDRASFAKVAASVLELIQVTKARGIPVLADFNDDHFDRSDLGPYWKALARTVDLCVVGSTQMADRVRQVSDRPICIVGDPVGSPYRPPKVFRSSGAVAGWVRSLLQPKGGATRLKLAWYGNAVNWPAMQLWAEAIAPLGKDQKFILWVVTSELDHIANFARDFNRRFGPDAIIELVPWEASVQWDVVADADVVLIPSNPSDATKAVKTSNRLTDALHSGRYVIASPLPSYLPFAADVDLTDDPLYALRQYLTHPDAALAKLTKGQANVVKQHTTESIAFAWLAAFDLARSSERAPVQAQDASKPGFKSPVLPVRLNLGCGDKILENYINVDVVAARAGKSPDVICDLRELTPFVSNYADEVMAVHVVEHFWRWEVEDVLKEWVRVLKPGGKLILECPNLQSACEAFLADPELRSAEGKQGQTTMWVFYGDPGWKDPLMIHRWGYTPKSLGKLLTSIGLVDVAQEPAQYKLREPRDMRVVGYKART